MAYQKVMMDDECLIDYIRKSKLFFPSELPYNLTTRADRFPSSLASLNPLHSLIMDKHAPWIEAVIAVETFVPKRGQRHFLECGALDGVTFSTTLHIERFLNWTGVLIEADNRFYEDLKNVNRKAYGVHACASPKSHPSVAVFQPSPIYIPVRFHGENLTIFNPGIGYIPNDFRKQKTPEKADVLEVQCVPVYSILLSVNLTTIDLFILDVEGIEMDILETIPFEKVDIAVFMIEMYKKPEKAVRRLHEFLESKGYLFYDTFSGGWHPGDDVFIKKEYLKSNDDLKKLEKSSTKDIFKILTGKQDASALKSDIENFVIEFSL